MVAGYDNFSFKFGAFCVVVFGIFLFIDNVYNGNNCVIVSLQCMVMMLAGGWTLLMDLVFVFICSSAQWLSTNQVKCHTVKSGY